MGLYQNKVIASLAFTNNCKMVYYGWATIVHIDIPKVSPWDYSKLVGQKYLEKQMDTVHDLLKVAKLTKKGQKGM